MINAIFLEHAFFKREDAFFRLMFGILLLIMLLGFIGWLAVIIYNLDVIRLTLVLFIATILSSLSNRRVKNKDATY
jgi:ABC-type multidrug transport system permease subunit